MKCPNCGFNSFDYLEECKKCKLPLNPPQEYKSLYKKVPRETVADSISLEESRVEKTRGLRNIDNGAEHEIRSEGIKSERALHSSMDEGIEVQAPDLGTEHGIHDELERRSHDPILYSESNVSQSATNLAGATDSKEEAESYSIAGLKLRAAAFAIDLVIISFITYLTIGAGFLLLGDTALTPTELSRVYLPIFALLFFLASTYFLFLHYYSGRTLGKMAVGIKVISSEGKELGLWESFMRWVGYYISAVFLFAGFIWSVFDRDSQAWHDKIAGTYVVIG